MMLALVDGHRTTAEPTLTGHCPGCHGEVIAKCGTINRWHWAHRRADADCDTWAEPTTQWHIDWQAQFPPHWCEIPLGDHRADVQLPTGHVVEFQHSSLSVAEIRERERHYGRMLWVFDVVDAHETDRLNLRRKKAGPHGDPYRTFRWKHPRRSILHCRRPVFLDIGGGWLFHLRRMYPTAPYGGWGYLITTDAFLARCGRNHQERKSA